MNHTQFKRLCYYALATLLVNLIFIDDLFWSIVVIGFGWGLTYKAYKGYRKGLWEYDIDEDGNYCTRYL